MPISVKKVLKALGYFLLTFLLLAGSYALSAYVLSSIPVEREEGQSSDVTIYILTNGVHTDLVLPARNESIDWTREVRFENTVLRDTTLQYLAFGWGDRGFYLETPTWSDLKFTTAFNAGFGLGTTAIHATYYKYLREGEDCRKIEISQRQYDRLVAYVQNSFSVDARGHFMVIPNAHYANTDGFYEAKGGYSLFHTCNTWANDGLKSCGQKAGWWTPFDKGIFRHYPISH